MRFDIKNRNLNDKELGNLIRGIIFLTNLKKLSLNISQNDCEITCFSCLKTVIKNIKKLNILEIAIDNFKNKTNFKIKEDADSFFDSLEKHSTLTTFKLNFSNNYIKNE